MKAVGEGLYDSVLNSLVCHGAKKSEPTFRFRKGVDQTDHACRAI